MIIGVKGARATKPEDSAAAYLSKYDPARSKAPIALGLALAAATGYLKALFSGTDAAVAAQPSRAHAPESGLPPEDSPAAQAAEEPAHSGTERDADPIPAGTSVVPQLAASAPGSVEAQPALRFEARGAQPFSRSTLPGAGSRSAPAVPEPALNLPPLPASGPALGAGAASAPGTAGDAAEPARTNRAPRVTGPVYLPDVAAGAVLLIGLDMLLQGAVDPDGDSLRVFAVQVSAGSLVPTQGGWLFRPAPDSLGLVTISYAVSDGSLAVAQTAHLRVVKSGPTLGSIGDDLLIGTPWADEIGGSEGNDNIDARAGDDVVTGGFGEDHILAGDGADLVLAGPGNDIVFGGAGNDRIFGGEGDDRIYGGAGDDVLYGDSGDDALHGDAGDDVLFGGVGDDRLADGTGRDALFGGEADDRVVAALDGAPDLFDGGAGTDILDYSAATAAVTVDLAGGTASGIEIGEDSVSGFETVIGGKGDDRLIAGAAPTVFAGGGGANLFVYGQPAEAGAPHMILDFKTGDRVRISKWDVFDQAVEALEDRFEKVYGGTAAAGALPVRFRHEEAEGQMRTTVEADLDRDDQHETVVSLVGYHNLVFIETC